MFSIAVRPECLQVERRDLALQRQIEQEAVLLKLRLQHGRQFHVPTRVREHCAGRVRRIFVRRRGQRGPGEGVLRLYCF